MNHKYKPYHHHDLPEGADDSFFLCKELKPGYLRGATGVYQTPGGYYVDDAEAEAFDRAFPLRRSCVCRARSSESNTLRQTSRYALRDISACLYSRRTVYRFCSRAPPGPLASS